MTQITDALQEVCNKIYRFIPRRIPSKQQLQETRIVAHRGAWDLSDHLENTLAAFSRCLKHNIWAIEFDIRWTADNIPVVHHDQMTKRIFNKDINISTTSFESLRAQIPQIPRLDEVIANYTNKMHFMIELKDKPTSDQSKILQQTLSKLTPVQDFHFMSLDIERFDALKAFPKKSFVSIARTNIKPIYQESLKREIGGMTGQYLLLSNRMKINCHKKEICVGTGFPDSKNLLFREINRGCDWIFTNRPIELAEIIQQKLQTL